MTRSGRAMRELGGLFRVDPIRPVVFGDRSGLATADILELRRRLRDSRGRYGPEPMRYFYWRPAAAVRRVTVDSGARLLQGSRAPAVDPEGEQRRCEFDVELPIEAMATGTCCRTGS